MSSGVLNSLLGGVAAIWCYPQVALLADLAAVAAAPPAVWHSALVAIEELTLTDLGGNKQWRRTDGGNLCLSMNAVWAAQAVLLALRRLVLKGPYLSVADAAAVAPLSELQHLACQARSSFGPGGARALFLYRAALVWRACPPLQLQTQAWGANQGYGGVVKVKATKPVEEHQVSNLDGTACT